MKRMTREEALAAGYVPGFGKLAKNTEIGEMVELLTPLEAEMLKTLEEVHEILISKNMAFTANAICGLIKKARGE